MDERYKGTFEKIILIQKEYIENKDQWRRIIEKAKAYKTRRRRKFNICVNFVKRYFIFHIHFFLIFATLIFFPLMIFHLFYYLCLFSLKSDSLTKLNWINFFSN